MFLRDLGLLFLMPALAVFLVAIWFYDGVTGNAEYAIFKNGDAGA